MVRLTLIEIASFFLPFLIFLLWRWQSRHDGFSHPTPVLKLAAIGASIAIILLFGLGFTAGLGGSHKGEQYVPARVVDGEVVPGHFLPDEPDEIPGDSNTGDDETP